MVKIPIWLDLVSGLLLAYEFFPKSGALSRFHERIINFLSNVNTNKPTEKRTILFNVIISLFTFIMLLLWAWYKSSSTPENNIGLEIGLFAIGWFIAWFLITLLVIIIKNIEQGGTLLIISVIISMLALGYIPKINPSPNVITSLIGFVYMCMFYSVAISSANAVRKVLLAGKDNKFYVFAVLGLTLFVAGKLIELAV